MTAPAGPEPPGTTEDVLATPLQYLKGVGPRRAADLKRAGLVTLEDLLYRFPIRYEDRSHLAPIATLKPGRPVSFAGRVLSCGLRSTRRPGFKIFEALIGDATGALRAIWLNQPFLREIFAVGQHVVFYGQLEMRGHGGLQVTNPQYEILEQDKAAEGGDKEVGQDVREGQDTPAEGAAGGAEDKATIHTGRIVPIYERTGAVTPKMQRRLVFDALQRLPAQLPEHLPEGIRARLKLPARSASLRGTHFPPSDAPLAALNRFETAAQQRLIFEEAFLFQVGVNARRRSAEIERKPKPITVDDRIRESARRVLPFRLTAGQRQALKEIVEDLQRPAPMNRLLQGDVGSGKTIVALLAAVVAMENGLQVAFMAPTEILAEQHFANISRLLESSRFRVSLVTGSTPSAARRDQLKDIRDGRVRLVVGTHALVQGDVAFEALGLVVIDEQHRFGVLQRATLRAKGLHPDVLVMTATPIPRTLALTVYGDLDVSSIRELPAGRLPVKTAAKPESRRDEVYAFARREIDAGRQMYVVYPLVEESEKIDLKAATAMADTLAGQVFPQYRVGLLHGRMKAELKEQVMRAFATGDLQILVSTTVVEVGIDVANASIMLVEHAERFGLSQLHQLRGRVGRGAGQSYCILLYQAPLSDESRDRLRAMTETTDGFEIAERDLRLRGPGDFFGTRQAGVPTFRLIDLVRDQALLEAARREASRWLEATKPSSKAVERIVTAWERRFKLIEVG
jgi:ATP-dependent DNA helicase RecG